MDIEKSKGSEATASDDRTEPPDPSPPSSPIECPPTPERVPDGCKTPPSGTSKEKVAKMKKQKIKKRRSRSLDAAGREDEEDGRSSPEDGGCPICLGRIENKAKTNTCFHEFCFTCLVEWSKVKPVCPLCKGKFSYVMHNIVSDTEYERYDLPTVADQIEETLYGNLSDYLMYNRRFRYHTTLAYSQLNRRRDQLERQLRNHVIPQLPDRGSNRSNRTTSGRSHGRRRRGPGTSEFRRQIYTNDLWVEPLPDISGRFRNCSPEWYRTNEAQTHRLIPFLNRELLALLEGGPHIAQQAYLTQQITEWVTRHEIMSPEMRDSLLPYLGLRTEHFQHELYNYARSTYDLIGYDNNVEYRARRLPAAEVVTSGSESDTPTSADAPNTAQDHRIRSDPNGSNRIRSEDLAILSDYQRNTLDRRNSQDGGLFSSASVIQSSLDVLNVDEANDRRRRHRRESRDSARSEPRQFRSRSADRREDWRKWRKRHYNQASAAERLMIDQSRTEREPTASSSSYRDRSPDTSRGSRERVRSRSRSRSRKDDRSSSKSSSSKSQGSGRDHSSPSSSRTSKDKDKSRKDRDESRKDRDESRKDRDESRKDRGESRKDRDESRKDKDGSKKDKDTKLIKDLKSSENKSREGSNDSKKDEFRKDKDESRKNKDKSRRGSDDSRSSKDESRMNKDESRKKKDKSRTGSEDSRSSKDETRSKDGESRKNKDESRKKKERNDAERKTKERSLDEVLAGSCDAFGVPFHRSTPPASEEIVPTSERPPRPENEILRRNAAAASALRMNIQMNQLQELINRQRASASTEVSGAAGGEKKEKSKEDRSRRKNRKPSRFLRHQQDLQRNYPVLVDEEEDPNQTIVLGSPPPRSFLNQSDVVEVIPNEAVEQLPIVIGSHTEIVLATSPPPSPGREVHNDGPIDAIDAPIDLRVPREEPEASTSRGISGGPERLVLPADSSSDSSEEDAGIKHFSGPLNNQTGPHILSESTGQLLPDAQELAQAAAYAAALEAPAVALEAPANLSRLSDSSDQDSDLEVLDVFQGKARKTKDPEIVELSDSDEEEDIPAPYSPVEVMRPFDPNEPIEISSGSDNEDQNPATFLQDLQFPDFQQGMAMSAMWDDVDQFRNVQEPERREKKKGKGHGKKSKPAPPPPQESSDEDDLIVVKTDYNTVDPITKREIVEPVKNKKCGHIYEKSTIYPMIDQARENQKPVRCPYMGCNCRDFKKTDLVKDREVLGHLETVRAERAEVKAEANRVEVEKRRLKAERRKKDRDEGVDSDQSADSIIEDVIELIKDGRKLKERVKEKVSDVIEEHTVSSSSEASHNRSSESEGGAGGDVVVEMEPAKEKEIVDGGKSDTQEKSPDAAETSDPLDRSSSPLLSSSPNRSSSPRKDASPSSSSPVKTSSPLRKARKEKRGRKGKSSKKEEVEEEEDNNEKAESSDDSLAPKPKKKKKRIISDAESEDKEEGEKQVEDDEKGEDTDDSAPQPTKKKKKKKVSESDANEEDGKKGSGPDSAAEVTEQPLQTKKSKRRRKVPERLNNSWSGSELDSDEELPSPRKRKVGRAGMKVTKIKKVTETWLYEGDEEGQEDQGKEKPKEKGKKKGKVKKPEADPVIEKAVEGKKGEGKKGAGKKKGKGKKGPSTSGGRSRRNGVVPSYVESNSDDEY